MKNLEPHTHTRLQSPRYIRILKLLPSAKQHARIQCRLAELDIDKYTSHDYKTPGPYEALSYVWGSTNGSISIECDGKALLVTENCHSALVRLQRRFGVELSGLILFASIRRKVNHRRKSALYKYNSWVSLAGAMLSLDEGNFEDTTRRRNIVPVI
ncbi:hypothetical protein BTUL_0118g00300 [Botrytis tulipae]|uniref:Heterokaryon incompatibility domain-containing protein n=1 Tax=Botrytis tulipae TaxID=87230 RepID=A0A4Z1EL02_9HELO|nr:hypothetical protein BTUL_0118g00300 [Botrytis tulipae]